MLKSLSLSNVALIKKQTIEFQDGFNCLLGQSGAGKSIIIDAMSFLLGAKADKLLIRSGENMMRVDGVFVSLSDEVRLLLEEFEIECDDELIITRTLSQDGKNSIKLCGFPVTLKNLQMLAQKLADFCAQHDSVGLLQPSNHLPILDKFAGSEVEVQKEKVAAEFDHLKEINAKILQLGGDEAQRMRTKDLLSFQIDEIEKAGLQLGEMEDLKSRFDFISSSEKIFERVGDALAKLEEGRENATALLYDAKNSLSGVCQFSEIQEAQTRIENAYYEVKDIAETLEIIKQNTEFDPLELERIDARLDLIKTLCKKYGKTVEEVLNFQQECQKQLEQLQNSEILLEKLQVQKLATEASLENLCKALSEMRKSAAKAFEQKICGELADLQMGGTHFQVDFQQAEFTKNGYDNVKFLFSANVGQQVRDLHKTASGGELSRLMLAFKNTMLGKEKVQTIVFDEIDSGISGQTAGKLAEKLASIAAFTQIVCITHTPVVAAKANNFLLVSKTVQNESTISVVSQLDKQAAICEVAKLIDGANEVSSTAILHSQKLFEE